MKKILGGLAAVLLVGCADSGQGEAPESETGINSESSIATNLPGDPGVAPEPGTSRPQVDVSASGASPQAGTGPEVPETVPPSVSGVAHGDQAPAQQVEQAQQGSSNSADAASTPRE